MNDYFASLIQQLTGGGQRPQIGMPGSMQGYQAPWAQPQMPGRPGVGALLGAMPTLFGGPQYQPPHGWQQLPGRPQPPMSQAIGGAVAQLAAPRPAAPQGRPMQPIRQGRRVSPGVYR